MKRQTRKCTWRESTANAKGKSRLLNEVKEGLMREAEEKSETLEDCATVE